MKKMFSWMAVLAIVALAGAVSAQDAPPTPPRVRPLVVGKITKIDGAKITVQPRARGGNQADDVVVTTDDSTKVKIDDADGKKVSDLKEGLYVVVQGEKDKPATSIVATTKAPTRGGGGGGGGAPAPAPAPSPK